MDAIIFQEKGWKTVLDIYAALYDIQYLEFSVLFSLQQAEVAFAML